MSKGIVIDVGFKADIKDFIDDIQKDFQQIDFGDIIKLSEEFKEQSKDVKKQLLELKEEIDKTINGKIPNDPNKQLQSLNKAVGVLASNFLKLAKNTPNMDKEILGQLDQITSEIGQLSDMCTDATNAVQELSNASNKKIQFVDKAQKEQLEELFKLLERSRQAMEKFGTTKNKSGNKPYEDDEEALRDIIYVNEIYEKSLKEIDAIQKDTTISSQERIEKLDKAYTTFALTMTNLSRIIASFDSKKGDMSLEIDSMLSLDGKKSIEAIRSQLDRLYEGVLDYIAQRQAEVQKTYYDLGYDTIGYKELIDMFKKSVSKDDSFKVPVELGISTRATTLRNKAIEIINKVNEDLADNPLDVEVRLISSHRSKANQKTLKEIRDSLANINDEDIKTKVSSLVNDMQKQIDDNLIFSVKVNTEKATNAVRDFIKDAQEELSQLSQNLAPIEPEVILTQEHKEAFQKQLDEAKGEFKIQVGIMDGEDTVDNNATKKELSYLKLLRERVEDVSKAVNEKSFAFLEEQDIVRDVISFERIYLDQLYRDLLIIEDQVINIANAFRLIPQTFNINFDQNMLDSLNKLTNHEVLSKLSESKEFVSLAISSGLGNGIEIPEEQKVKLLNDIQKLSSEINTIFETKGIDAWSSKFLSSLNEISQKIKTLFGNNALNDVLEQWIFSDELMKKTLGNSHLRERAAIIGKDGKIYGSGTYDEHDSTRFGYKIIEELKKQGVTPSIGIHSHSSDRIVASSTSQYRRKYDDKNNLIEEKLSAGDIAANYFDYIKYGVEKQLTVALNDIELFDAKGFYDSNKSINFNSEDIQKKIADKKDELVKEMNKNFYQYFDRFIEQYSTKNKNGILNSLFNSNNLSNGIDNKKIIDALKSQTNGIDLESEFLKYLKTFTGSDINVAFKNFLASQFSFSSIDFKSLGVDGSIVENFKKHLGNTIKGMGDKIIKKAYGLDEGFEINNGRDLGTFNFRQITSRILEEALKGTGYKNNYQDFMKVYSIEEFIKQNPIGLSSGTLSDLFDNTAPTNFLQTLDKIVADLKEIKDISIGDSLQGSFNVKLDNESINNFTEEINRLIEAIEKLPKIITDAFSSFESAIPKDPVKEIDKEIQKLNDDIKETEIKIKDLEDQISDSQINNKSHSNIDKNSVDFNDNKISGQNLSLYKNLLQWATMNQLDVKSGIQGLPEQVMVGNIFTGFASDANIEGKVAGITDELVDSIIKNATDEINTLIHSHPEEYTAAFSFDDIEKSAKRLSDGISYQITTSLNDLAMLDVSVFSKDDLLKISKIMKELTVDYVPEFDRYSVKSDNAYIYEFSNNLNENIQYLLDNIINELSKAGYSSSIIDEFETKFVEQFTDSTVNLNSFDEIEKSLQNFYIAIAKSLNINNIDVFDTAYGNIDSKILMDFQENMLKQAINELSSSGQLSKIVDFSDIYKKFSIEEFMQYSANNLLGKQSANVKSNVVVESQNDIQEELKKLKEKHELLLKQVELLKEQKRLLTKDSTQGSDTSVNLKTDAFKLEGSTVDKIVKGEIKNLDKLEQKLNKVKNAVNAKTEAFKNEGKVVGEVIGEETTNLNPLQNLDSAYNIFKPFYDNDDLESEEGAKAALSYYNAYKEALVSKVNKKDLKQFTLGKELDLFTGNYTNYKRGVGELDLSGLNSQISKYETIIEKFNQPEVISVINALTEAIQKLLDTGNTSDKATKLLTELNKAINNLGGKSSSDKIAKIATNLENFQKSIQILDISDSGILKSLSSILEKGEELKALGEVLKSTKKQIDSAEKAVKAENNFKQSQKYLEQYENDIKTAVNNKYGSDNVLYQQLQATKDGVVQVTAMVQEGENAYKKYILTTTNGSDLMVKAINDNAAALSKEIKQWKAYQKLKELTVPGARNLGEEGVTFTPDSENWSKLVEKAREFGIEIEDIVKIIRNVDEIGQESFQIFTKLSRVTVGMDSNGILFQKDEVLDINKLINDFKKNVDDMQKSLGGSFKGDDKAIQTFLNSLKEIQDTWKGINSLHKKGLISDNDFASLEQYFNSFKTSISAISLDKISIDKKTPEFLEQLETARTQLISLQDVLDKVNAGQMISDDDIEQIQLFISQVRTLYSTMKNKENKVADFGSVQKVLGKIADILTKNSAMSKDLKNRFRELSQEIYAFGENIPADKMKEFTNRFEALKTEMLETGQTGLSFFDGVWQRAKSMSKSFISMYLSLWDIIRYVKTGITYIKELDTALTEMRKVSDESVSSLKNFQKVSFDIADTIGTTAKQIQNSAADFMRLGYSLEEAVSLAKDANIYANVGDMEIEEATEHMISSIKAWGSEFNNEVEASSAIIDRYNEIGNNFAITSADIGSAMERSAAALKAGGNTLNESLGLITAGNLIQQDADTTANALKVLSLRIRGSKTDLEEMGESTDDLASSTSKLREEIKALTGVDIMADENTYKSTAQIITEIGAVWENLSDVSQANIIA